jgi:hypothetical protein
VIPALLAVVGLSVLTPAGAAQAGTSCGTFSGCSHVRNSDNQAITAKRNWLCGGTTGASTADPNCVSGDVYWLNQGDQTPIFQDWDVVRVDARWCYKIHFVNWWGKSWTERYDRRAYSTPLYVKVENGSIGEVVDQSLSTCP